jgi:thiol-disulfide isomerase/thioredoxin
MGTGLVIVVAALVLALGFGLYRAATDGRFRGTKAVLGASVPTESSSSSSPVTWDAVTAALPSAEMGERATLLQFSSAFCAPCRVTRQVLTDVAGLVPGVVHLEVDAEHHLELVRELGIMRTPTTLILDATGAEATRAMGAPRREAVLATLDGIV